jgi:hypothetical protein
MNVVFCAINGFAWVWLRQHDVRQAIGGGPSARSSLESLRT